MGFVKLQGCNWSPISVNWFIHVYSRCAFHVVFRLNAPKLKKNTLHEGHLSWFMTNILNVWRFVGLLFPPLQPTQVQMKNVHVVHSNGFFSVKSDGFVKVEIGNFKVYIYIYICFVSNTWKWVQIDNVFLQMLVNSDQGNPQTCLVGWRQTFWETFRHCLDLFFFGPQVFFCRHLFGKHAAETNNMEWGNICIHHIKLQRLTWDSEYL